MLFVPLLVATPSILRTLRGKGSRGGFLVSGTARVVGLHVHAE